MSASTALVPVERAPLEFGEDLPEQCRLFLGLFVKMRYVGKAADAMGISRNQHRRWLGLEKGHGEEVPGFAEAFDVAIHDVCEQNYELLGEINERGLRETLFDAGGKLKHTRYRQSEALIKMHMTAQDPDRYAHDRDSGTKVVIVLNHTNEGGWTEDE